MSKPVIEFEVIPHGKEHEQYFSGAGLSHTRFLDMATGIGVTAKEATDDALEALAQNDWDIEGLENTDAFKEEVASFDPDDKADGEGQWWYVSVYVK